MVSGAAVSVAGGRDREVLVECRGVGDKAAYPSTLHVVEYVLNTER
jgi:hypothetical protein